MGKSESDSRFEQERLSESPVIARKPRLPVDHGWAWCVMFGAFLNTSVILMFIRSMAILFIQFLEKYQESATMTTLAFGLCSVMFALSNFLGPTILMHHFEVRTLAFTGSVINFLGITAISFAPNIIIIDVMMACLGLSHGLMSVPQTTLLGQYFKKRLSFANAFVNLGISIGTIAGPPLTQFLLDNYGLQGTIMILAGVNMNCMVGSMLLRPVSLYAPADDELVPESEKETIHKEDRNKCYITNGKLYNSDEIKSVEESTGLTAVQPTRMRTLSEDGMSDETVGDTNDLENQEMSVTSGVRTKRSYRRQSSISDVIDMVSTSSSIKYLNDPRIFFEASISKGNRPDKKSSEHVDELHERNSFQSMEHQNEVNEKSTWIMKFRKSVSKSIYTHPLGILLILASGLGVHSATCIAYMPSAGRENGLSDDQIPYLITIIGVCDLISKLGIGLFADMGYVKRIHIAVVAQLILGTLLQFLRFFQSFIVMILYQIVLGLTLGVLHVLVAVVAVDILGVKHMGHIFAGYFLVNGFVIFFDHFVIGFMKDSTNSFLFGYNYIGAIILLSAFLLLLEPFVARLKPLPDS